MSKAVLISSTGGHWTQLNQIYTRCITKEGVQLITEKNLSNSKRKDILFFIQQDRKHFSFLFVFLFNIILAIIYAIKCRPKVVISTGAGVTVPFLFLAKIMGSKIIFIESYAKVYTPTITGRIVYKFADEFFVQWPEMLKYYPKANYKGSLY